MFHKPFESSKSYSEIEFRSFYNNRKLIVLFLYESIVRLLSLTNVGTVDIFRIGQHQHLDEILCIPHCEDKALKVLDIEFLWHTLSKTQRSSFRCFQVSS